MQNTSHHTIPDPSPCIELRNISKSFGSVHANSNISLKFYAGKIKALLGENGAGKSTLMSMLAGKLRPDTGEILINSVPTRLNTSKDALNAGIGMVYQHFMLIDAMTVAENVLLGQDFPAKTAGPNWYRTPKKMETVVAELAEQYKLPLKPNALVGSLSMGEKQRVEILKLLYRQSNVLIFDEPTAVLTPLEAEQLFIALNNMKQQGKALIFISHKLQEVLAIADEIAILRQGKIIDEFTEKPMPNQITLANRMIGKDVFLQSNHERMAPQEVVLEVNSLQYDYNNDKTIAATKNSEQTAENITNRITFSLHRGEIIAIAGVAGNGQKELAETICGLRQPLGGSVSILGKSWKDFFDNPPKIEGLSYIPEDRQGLATVSGANLTENFLLTTRKMLTIPYLTSILRKKAPEQATKKLIGEYDIRPGTSKALARNLSGGNLQKLVIGREFYRKPKLIVAENPTQGLDILAIEEVWARLVEARKHAGILLITGDLNEALNLADEIAVMYEGKFIDFFDKTNKKKVDAIGLMMAGVEQK